MGMGTVSARSAEHGDVMKILVSTCRSALGLCCSHHLKLSKPSIRRRIAASIMALRRRCDLEEGIHWNGPLVHGAAAAVCGAREDAAALVHGPAAVACGAGEDAAAARKAGSER
jgi:hypothetical protein